MVSLGCERLLLEAPFHMALDALREWGRCGPPELAPGGLRARVEVTRRRRQPGFVAVFGVVVGIEPDRARVDDPRDAGGTRCLEHGDSAPGVASLSVLGLGMDVVDVSDGCPVGQCVAA